MDSTTAPRGARAPRPTDPHNKLADPHGTRETQPPAGAGRRPGGSGTGVANPNRVRVGSDGRPGPADRSHG